jgi:hypothetical protein
MTRIVTHHPLRTWIKAVFGIGLAAMGFVLYGAATNQELEIASIVMFVGGLLLTRHYGIQTGQLKLLAKEGQPFRLAHSAFGIILRLLIALAAAASCVLWIVIQPEAVEWLTWVPKIGLAVAVIFTLQYFRRLVLKTVADVKSGGGGA